MDIEKLIRRLRNDADAYRNGKTLGRAFADQEDVLDNAATALSTLQAENERLRKELEYEREHANAYHEECGQWEAENEKLRAELERVKEERDAAIKDLFEIIGDIEEIRCGYGVDNADADKAFAELCNGYCANAGNLCYEEGEHYRCKHFKWRGPHKED